MPSHPLYPSRLLKHLLPQLMACALIGLTASTFAQTPVATAPASANPAVTTPATTPAAPSKPTTPSGVVGDHNTQLSDHIPPEQQLQLQAGDDKFSARYIADLSPEHRGAVIVLHDSGQHQSWPFTVAALLDDLPQFGWSTLAIELPAPAQDAINKTSTPNVSTPVTATTPPTTPPATPPTPATTPIATTTGELITGSEEGIEKQTQSRVDAALKKLAELNQDNSQATVLIGFGSGAWREVEFARKQAQGNGAKSAEPLRALVLIDARNNLPTTKVDLPKLLPATELSTLDIVQSSENLPRADAEARRRAVLHQKSRIYQQLFLPPLNARNATEQTLLVKRIRSWIQRNVPADEPKKSKSS